MMVDNHNKQKEEIEYCEKLVKNIFDLAMGRARVFKKAKGGKKTIYQPKANFKMFRYIMNLSCGKPIVPINGRTTRPLTSKEIARTERSIMKLLAKYDFVD